MKCALNDGNLYRSPEYMCQGCVFEEDEIDICKILSFCDNNSVLKRSHDQSDIFKI